MKATVENVWRDLIRRARERAQGGPKMSFTDFGMVRELEHQGIDTWAFWRTLWNLPEDTERPKDF